MNLSKLPTQDEVKQEMQTLLGHEVTGQQAQDMLLFFLRCLRDTMTVEPGMLEQDQQ